MTAPSTSRSPSPETQPPVALRGAELVAAIGASPELFEEARSELVRLALAVIHGQRVGEMAVHYEMHDDTAVWDASSLERAWEAEWSAAADSVGGG